MKYIVKGPRRHGKWDYFMGFHETNVPIVTLERRQAKEMDESEANTIIELLSGPYTKYEKEQIK